MSAPDTEHCVAKVVELAGRPEPTRRELLQLGYNLGRLAELTGLGREPFWDRWKDAVDRWDRLALERLAHDLRTMNQGAFAAPSHHSGPEHPILPDLP